MKRSRKIPGPRPKRQESRAVHANPAHAKRASAKPATAKPSDGPAGRRAVRHQGRNEEAYHGARACAALFARRPQDVIRVYVAAERRRHWAALLEYCAQARRGFQVVAAENLARLSGSTHHEGIVILARTPARWGFPELLRGLDERRVNGPLLYLDGVQNPHNLGAILRTAAHFGVGAVLGAEGELPPLSPAAVRVAEGAAEHVPVCALGDPRTELPQLSRRGFRLVATSSHQGGPLSAVDSGGNIVLVMGSEGEGVSKPLADLADAFVRVSGTGVVESLNVSVACGILLADAWSRRQHPRGDRPGK